jgi:hypothetical protein
MKMFMRMLFGALIASIASHSFGADAWLVIEGQGQTSLVHASEHRFEVIEAPGRVMVFANAGARVGAITYDHPTRLSHLLLVDEKTQKIEAIWPLAEFPASQLMGPSEDLVVQGDHAYFISVRYASDGSTIERNDLGGAFDLIRVSIKNGKEEKISIPKESANPRLSTVGGTVVITETFSARAWGFDEKAKVLNALDDGDYRHFGNSRRGMVPGASPTEFIADDSVFELPDASAAYVDIKTNTVRLKSKNGEPQVLWDLNQEMPGSTPSIARVISIVL